MVRRLRYVSMEVGAWLGVLDGKVVAWPASRRWWKKGGYFPRGRQCSLATAAENSMPVSSCHGCRKKMFLCARRPHPVPTQCRIYELPTVSGFLFSSNLYVTFISSILATYFSCASSAVRPSSTIFCQAFNLALPCGVG